MKDSQDNFIPQRTINKSLLRELVFSKGRRGREVTALAVDCSSSLLSQLTTGARLAAPEASIRIRLCNYFNVTQDALFPLDNKSAIGLATPNNQQSPQSQTNNGGDQVTHKGVYNV